MNNYRWRLVTLLLGLPLPAEKTKKAGLLKDFTHGFEIVPYLAFHFGGHINEETFSFIDKSKKPPVTTSVIVPRHAIFRTYVGVKTKFEWRLLSLPMSLTLDENMLHLATREQIGVVTTKEVFLRQLKGFHHRGKASLDFALDPNKHYSFTLTYENGRLAPNLEYLSKFSSGIKIPY